MRREGQGDPEGAVKGRRLWGPGLREGQKPQRWAIRPVGHQSPGGVLGGAVGAEPGHAGSRWNVNVTHDKCRPRFRMGPGRSLQGSVRIPGRVRTVDG